MEKGKQLNLTQVTELLRVRLLFPHKSPVSISILVLIIKILWQSTGTGITNFKQEVRGERSSSAHSTDKTEWKFNLIVNFKVKGIQQTGQSGIFDSDL